MRYFLIALLFLGCSHQRSVDRDGGLQAAKWVAGHTLDGDLTRVLRDYVKIGALKHGDTIVAEDSIAMIFIGYNSTICWVRLSDSLRFGERLMELPDGRHVIPREVRARPTRPDLEGTWACETTAW